MKQWPGVLALMLASSILGTSPALAACGTTTLVVRVRDLQDVPVANIVFVVEIEGATQMIHTDATGLITIPITCGANGTPTSARIVRASGASGVGLLMDENTTEGGLVIPLIVGGTQQQPFLLSDKVLFVEPFAEPDPSAAVNVSTPVPSMLVPAESAVPVSVVVATPPIPQASRPWWFWAAILLVLGAPLLLGALIWWRRVTAARRWPQ